MWVKVGAGALSGLTQTLIFNPWDRALYLSVKDDRVFLDRRNWREPFRGCTQAVGHRTCTTGLWWPLLDVMLPPARMVAGPGREPLAQLLAGNGAGVVNGLVLNWISAARSMQPRSMHMLPLEKPFVLAGRLAWVRQLAPAVVNQPPHPARSTALPPRRRRSIRCGATKATSGRLSCACGGKAGHAHSPGASCRR